MRLTESRTRHPIVALSLSRHGIALCTTSWRLVRATLRSGVLSPRNHRTATAMVCIAKPCALAKEWGLNLESSAEHALETEK